MTSLQTYLAEVKARLEKATPGRWIKSEVRETDGLGNFEGLEGISVHAHEDGPIICDMDAETDWHSNATLIANCPTDLSKLIQIVEALSEGLERIENHKQTSIDKVYLLNQCDGYKSAAREALKRAEDLAHAK